MERIKGKKQGGMTGCLRSSKEAKWLEQSEKREK